MGETAQATYRTATENDFDVYLDMMYEHAADYLEPSLMLMGIDRDEFSKIFRTVGTVRGIEADGHIAGFYWVEPREETLHIHALIVKPDFQKRGLAHDAMDTIVADCGKEIKRIELGVHRENDRALKVYESAGFKVVRELDEFDFYIMHKDLA